MKCSCSFWIMPRPPGRPRDTNQLAKSIVDIATGVLPNDSTPAPDDPRVAARRRSGGKGGKARAAALGPRKRREIARKAAAARWRPEAKK